MFLLDQLNTASFRGVEFFVDSHDAKEGRKIVPHEFPNKKPRYVEDLGGLSGTYKIRGVISGLDYWSRRSALMSALNAPGIGILIHPFFGTKRVVAEPYEVHEDIKDLGKAVFSMSFLEAADNIFPSQSTDNTALINNLSLESLQNAQNNFSNLWSVGSALKANYQNAQKVLGGLSTRFDNIVSPYNSIPAATSQYRLNLTNFNQGINKNIFDSNILSNQIGTLFTSLDSVTPTSRELFNLNKTFFNYQSSTALPTVSTVQLQQLVTNNQALDSLVNIAGLANAYNAAINIDYTDEDDLNAIQSLLDAQYYYCLDNTPFDEDTITFLKDLRNQVRIYFDTIALNIKRLLSITVQPTTITVLTFNYYNSLDNDTLLMSINGLTNPGLVEGNLQIVSST